jgi:hypothetical protein
LIEVSGGKCLFSVAFYEHSIIAAIEGQRISRNLTVFGIKNAREFAIRSGHDQLLLLSIENEQISGGPP